MLLERAAIARLLDAWATGALGPAELKQSIDGATAPSGDRAAAEVLAALDLLEVHLLLPEDVPALRALLASDGSDDALAAWSRHLAAIDLDARSKRLKRDRFYRPFCR